MNIIDPTGMHKIIKEVMEQKISLQYETVKEKTHNRDRKKCSKNGTNT